MHNDLRTFMRQRKRAYDKAKQTNNSIIGRNINNYEMKLQTDLDLLKESILKKWQIN